MTRTTSSLAGDRATAYAKNVIAGRIVAGPHVRNTCQRHLDDLKQGKERGLKYDKALAARAIRFFETKLKLSEGHFEGTPFLLEPSQAFIVGSIFGWQKKSEVHGWVRRFHTAYVEEGKGNGKSPLAGGIGTIGLMVDDEPGAEIYSAGATKDQAGILFRDAIKMRKQSPDIRKRTKTSGGEGREFNLAYPDKSSFFRPVSRETKKTGSGPRPHMALCDEVHEHPDRGVIEMLKRGFKFRRQPLLLLTTNSGTDRKSVCWEYHEHAVRVAAGNRNARSDNAVYLGDPIDDRFFSYVCALDEGDDPLEDPSCWIKANPLLGVTITEEYLQEQVDEGKALPGNLNGIKRLHFCQWTDAETAWMSEKTLRPCLVDFEPTDEHGGKEVFLSADLSQVKDITALGYCAQSGVVESGEHKGKPIYDAWVQAFTPRDTLLERAKADKQPYDLWVEKGHLIAPKGKVINYRHVAQALAEAQHDYDVKCLAYDRYAFSRMLEPEMNELGLTIECVEHPQGGTKKGKPTEAMKEAAKKAGREPEGLWMPMSVRMVEQLIYEGRLRIHNNPVIISAIMSAMTDEDRWNNYWLAKERSTNKIDAAVALCMAVGAASAFEAKKPKKHRIIVV